MEKVEIRQMPTKEQLEAFLTQMVMGTEVVVYFDWKQGVFTQHEPVRPEHTDTQ